MNENINLVEILKDCPKDTKLYSTIFGEVKFKQIKTEFGHQYVIIELKDLLLERINFNGKLYNSYDGECMLFPSRDQRDWSKFQSKKPKFDPKTLQPFDRVLVQCNKSENWRVQLFSYIIEGEVLYPYVCIGCNYKYCIPYNNDTKHLVGTSDEAPEYYRYWED